MRTLKEDFFDNIGIGEESLIKDWLESYKIKNYTINDDFTIDVKGDVYLIEYKEKQLPDYIQFGKVTGIFNIILSCSLETLKGCPQEVGKTFYCNFCENLISLKDCPLNIGKDFECVGCEKLKSLKGAPRKVGLKFDCSLCPKLTSLEGAPKEVGGDFRCQRCGVQFTKDDIKKVSKVKGKIKI